MYRESRRSSEKPIPKRSDVSKRGRWGGSVNYIMAQLSNTVGLGNVWRFPYLVFIGGGGAFLVPYLVMMLLVGIPLCALELTLGQFTGCGPTTCYEFCPIFSGVGYGTLILGLVVNAYYSVIISWGLYYLVKSFTKNLPWSQCQREWATDYCRDFLLPSNVSACNASGWLIAEDGACYNTSVSPKRITALWNLSLASDNNIHRVIPTMEYLRREVLGVDKEGVDLYHLGQIHWNLVACLFFTWLFTCMALIRGIRSFIPVAYVTFICSGLVLVIFFCFSWTLAGASEGIKYYITPNSSKLLEHRVWYDAAGQVFYTLSISTATLIGLASYNDFRSDPLAHAVILSVVNTAVSLVAGFIIFCCLGFMAKKMEIDIHQLAVEGSSLVFGVFPFALAQLPNATFWATLFFLMIYSLALSTTVTRTQTLFCALYDMVPSIRIHRKPTRVLLCLLYFLVSLPMVTDGGLLIVHLLDKYLFIFNIYLLSLLMVVAVAWVYGLQRFLVDIEVMLGMETLCCVPWACAKYYLGACLVFFCPVLLSLTVLEILSLMSLDELDNNGLALGVCVSCITLLPVVICAVLALLRGEGSVLQRLRAAARPSNRWGPAKHKQRKLWRSLYAARLGIHRQASTSDLNARQRLDDDSLTAPLSEVVLGKVDTVSAPGTYDAVEIHNVIKKAFYVEPVQLETHNHVAKEADSDQVDHEENIFREETSTGVDTSTTPDQNVQEGGRIHKVSQAFSSAISQGWSVVKTDSDFGKKNKEGGFTVDPEDSTSSVVDIVITSPPEPFPPKTTATENENAGGGSIPLIVVTSWHSLGSSSRSQKDSSLSSSATVSGVL